MSTNVRRESNFLAPPSLCAACPGRGHEIDSSSIAGRCSQVRSLTAALLSTCVTTVIVVLLRLGFKHAGNVGEGSKVAKFNKWRRTSLLREICSEKMSEKLNLYSRKARATRSQSACIFIANA